MEKEFVTYELAVKLKALGFDEPCFGYYYTLNGKDWKFAEKNDYYSIDDELNIGGKFSLLAPTFSQAFRWLMQFPQIKKYRYNIALYPDGTYSLKDGKDSIYEYLSGDDCIDKLIEIVENK
jgi:hypothetical protein